MNINFFINKAWKMGFDTVASLGLEQAEAAIAEWKTHLRDGDRVSPLSTDPREVLPEARTILVFAYPYRLFEGYPEGVGQVSGYYIASNRAYHALDELTRILQRQGICALHTHKLPLKPLARAAGLGRYGRNGVIVRSGTHIVLGTIIIDAEVKLPPVNVPVPGCESCGVCEKACPTSCLKGGYVEADRCLRSYMTHDIDKIPDDMRELMGERLIGCDECLNACPGLVRDRAPDRFSELFNWEALADETQFAKNRDEIASLIGSNNASAMHIRAVRQLGVRS